MIIPPRSSIIDHLVLLPYSFTHVMTSIYLLSNNVSCTFMPYKKNAWTDEEIDTRNIATTDVIVAVKDVQDTSPRFYDLPNIVRLTDDMKTVSYCSLFQG